MVKYKLKNLFNLFAGGDIDIEHFSQYKTPVHCFPIYSNSLNNKGLYGYTSVPKYKGNSITIQDEDLLVMQNVENKILMQLFDCWFLSPRSPIL
jgi:type I restriction enzyme S subunit